MKLIQPRTVNSYKRNLPHIEIPGSAYFITWSTKNRHILSPSERDITASAIMFFNLTRIFVYQYVIMPDHSHAILQPLKQPSGEYPALSSITRSIKGFSGREINKLRNSSGPVWMDETYDHIIEDDFDEIYYYIAQNAVRKGLATHPNEYPWYYTDPLLFNHPILRQSQTL